LKVRSVPLVIFRRTRSLPYSFFFAAGDDAFPENPVLDCHVAGVPVRDLPIEMHSRILYQQTDEGIAQAAAEVTERNGGLQPSGVQVGTDALDKQLEERRADLRAGKDPRHAQSPLRFLDNLRDEELFGFPSAVECLHVADFTPLLKWDGVHG